MIISDPEYRNAAEVRLQQMRDWLDTRLEQAKIAADEQDNKDKLNNDSKCIVMFIAESTGMISCMGENSCVEKHF